MMDFDHDEIFESFEDEFQKTGRRRRPSLPIPPWMLIVLLVIGVGIFLVLRSTNSLQTHNGTGPGEGTKMTTELLAEAAALSAAETLTATVSATRDSARETLITPVEPQNGTLTNTEIPQAISSEHQNGANSEGLTAQLPQQGDPASEQAEQGKQVGISTLVLPEVADLTQPTPTPQKKPNVFQRIGGFFSNLFGGSDPTPAPTETPYPLVSATDSAASHDPQPTALSEEPSWGATSIPQGSDSPGNGANSDTSLPDPIAAQTTSGQMDAQPKTVAQVNGGTAVNNVTTQESPASDQKTLTPTITPTATLSDLDDDPLKFEDTEYDDTVEPEATVTLSAGTTIFEGNVTPQDLAGEPLQFAVTISPTETNRSPVQGGTVTALKTAVMPDAIETATVPGMLAARNQILQLTQTPQAATEAAIRNVQAQSGGGSNNPATVTGVVRSAETAAPEKLIVRATELPDTGFADSLNLPLLLLIICVLAGVILAVRIIRKKTAE